MGTVQGAEKGRRRRSSGGEGGSGRTSCPMGKRSAGAKIGSGLRGREDGRASRTPNDEAKGGMEGADCVMLDEKREGERLRDSVHDSSDQCSLNQPQTKG